MIKMIALDMDGTLMSPDHLTVSDENKKALKKAHNSGAKIAIATGRTVAIIGDVCEQVPEIDYIIFSNGAGVYDRKNDKLVYSNPMTFEHTTELLNYLEEIPCFIELYIDRKSYYQIDKVKDFCSDVFPQEFLDELLNSMIPCESLVELIQGKDVEKITVYINDKELYKTVWDHFDSDKEVSLATSFFCSMETTKAGVDKGVALKGLCDSLGITSDECMAFGDAGNDCPMLEFAKYGFAMENATDVCKKSAKFVTKSNAEDGVAYGINQYI